MSQIAFRFSILLIVFLGFLATQLVDASNDSPVITKVDLLNDQTVADRLFCSFYRIKASSSSANRQQKMNGDEVIIFLPESFLQQNNNNDSKKNHSSRFDLWQKICPKYATHFVVAWQDENLTVSDFESSISESLQFDHLEKVPNISDWQNFGSPICAVDKEDIYDYYTAQIPHYVHNVTPCTCVFAGVGGNQAGGVLDLNFFNPIVLKGMPMTTNSSVVQFCDITLWNMAIEKLVPIYDISNLKDALNPYQPYPPFAPYPFGLAISALSVGTSAANLPKLKYIPLGDEKYTVHANMDPSEANFLKVTKIKRGLAPRMQFAVPRHLHHFNVNGNQIKMELPPLETLLCPTSIQTVLSINCSSIKSGDVAKYGFCALIHSGTTTATSLWSSGGSQQEGGSSSSGFDQDLPGDDGCNSTLSCIGPWCPPVPPSNIPCSSPSPSGDYFENTQSCGLKSLLFEDNDFFGPLLIYGNNSEQNQKVFPAIEKFSVKGNQLTGSLNSILAPRVVLDLKQITVTYPYKYPVEVPNLTNIEIPGALTLLRPRKQYNICLHSITNKERDRTHFYYYPFPSLINLDLSSNALTGGVVQAVFDDRPCGMTFISTMQTRNLQYHVVFGPGNAKLHALSACKPYLNESLDYLVNSSAHYEEYCSPTQIRYLDVSDNPLRLFNESNQDPKNQDDLIPDYSRCILEQCKSDNVEVRTMERLPLAFTTLQNMTMRNISLTIDEPLLSFIGVQYPKGFHSVMKSIDLSYNNLSAYLPGLCAGDDNIPGILPRSIEKLDLTNSGLSGPLQFCEAIGPQREKLKKKLVLNPYHTEVTSAQLNDTESYIWKVHVTPSVIPLVLGEEEVPTQVIARDNPNLYGINGVNYTLDMTDIFSQLFSKNNETTLYGYKLFLGQPITPYYTREWEKPKEDPEMPGRMIYEVNVTYHVPVLFGVERLDVTNCGMGNTHVEDPAWRLVFPQVTSNRSEAEFWVPILNNSLVKKFLLKISDIKIKMYENPGQPVSWGVTVESPAHTPMTRFTHISLQSSWNTFFPWIGNWTEEKPSGFFSWLVKEDTACHWKFNDFGYVTGPKDKIVTQYPLLITLSQVSQLYLGNNNLTTSHFSMCEEYPNFVNVGRDFGIVGNRSAQVLNFTFFHEVWQQRRRSEQQENHTNQTDKMRPWEVLDLHSNHIDGAVLINFTAFSSSYSSASSNFHYERSWNFSDNDGIVALDVEGSMIPPAGGWKYLIPPSNLCTTLQDEFFKSHGSSELTYRRRWPLTVFSSGCQLNASRFNNTGKASEEILFWQTIYFQIGVSAAFGLLILLFGLVFYYCHRKQSAGHAEAHQKINNVVECYLAEFPNKVNHYEPSALNLIFNSRLEGNKTEKGGAGMVVSGAGAIYQKLHHRDRDKGLDRLQSVVVVQGWDKSKSVHSLESKVAMKRVIHRRATLGVYNQIKNELDTQRRVGRKLVKSGHLQNHYIIRLLAFNEDCIANKSPYITANSEAATFTVWVDIVLEYAPHGSLQNLINNVRYLRCIGEEKKEDKAQIEQARKLMSECRYGFIPERIVIMFLMQLLDAVVFLHASNIVHRDIKPDNIVLMQGGFVIKLTDFGLATLTKTEGDDVGTMFYKAPEVREGNYGDLVDVFSVGMVAIALMGVAADMPGATTEKTYFQYINKFSQIISQWKKKSEENADLKNILRALRPPMFAEERVFGGGAKPLGGGEKPDCNKPIYCEPLVELVCRMLAIKPKSAKYPRPNSQDALNALVLIARSLPHCAGMEEEVLGRKLDVEHAPSTSEQAFGAVPASSMFMYEI